MRISTIERLAELLIVGLVILPFFLLIWGASKLGEALSLDSD